MSAVKLLLIEDSPSDADLIIMSLEDAVDLVQFKIHHVDCLGDGLKYLESNEVDVILSDLSLPDADGLSTFSRINEQVPSKPIVVLTGLDDTKVALEAVKSGAQDYLVKGELHGRFLVRSICYAIERKRAQEEIKNLTGQLQEANEQLDKLASNDPLTDLLNRRGLERALQHEANLVNRGKERPIAILVDCDDFKGINEKYGHAIGDLALKVVADGLRNSLRVVDYAARIGGDEFLAFLPCTSQEDGLIVAERIRETVANSVVRLPGADVTVTVSLGVSSLGNIWTIEGILAACRNALKDSKAAGKNTISCGSADADDLKLPSQSVSS